MRFILIIFIGLLVSGFAVNDARKANEAYKRGDYEKAVQLYRSAIQQAPDNPRLYFNLGNALAQTGDHDEAARAYDQYRRMIENPGEESLADYNQGRMLTDAENYEDALNYFREALKKNPEDADARYNYELAKRRQQQQEQNQDQQQQQNQDQDQDQNQDNENQNQQNQDQQQNDQQQNNQQQNPDSEQEQNREQQPRPQELTREEAENLLDALEQLERELLENQKKESSQRNTRNDKDW